MDALGLPSEAPQFGGLGLGAQGTQGTQGTQTLKRGVGSVCLVKNHEVSKRNFLKQVRKRQLLPPLAPLMPLVHLAFAVDHKVTHTCQVERFRGYFMRENDPFVRKRQVWVLFPRGWF